MLADLCPSSSSSSAVAEVAVKDSRASLTGDHVVYKNLHRYRIQQLELGLSTDMLTDIQWGLKLLDKCHHISTTTTTSAATGMLTIQSYRVRICKTCCQEANHIELGTYMDQESAILVNDVFELLNQRYEKLIVLRAEDVSTLQLLTARKYDRTKGKDYCSILELLAERLQGNVEQMNKKRKSPSSSSSGSMLSPDVAGSVASGETASLTSEETNSNPARVSLLLYNAEEVQIRSSEKKQKRVSHSPGTPEHIIATSIEDEEEEEEEEDDEEPLPSQPYRPAPGKAMPPSPTRSPTFMRQRSYTFSTAADFSASSFHRHNGMDTLAWFATLADDEVAVAKSLFELGSAKKAAANDEFLQSLNNRDGGVGGGAASYLVSGGFSYLSPKRVRDEAHADFIDPYQSNQYLTSYPSFYPSEQRKQASTLPANSTTSGEDKLRLLSSAGLLMGDMSGIVLNSPLREIRPAKYAFAAGNLGEDDDEDDEEEQDLRPLLPAFHRRPRSQSMSVIEGSLSAFANVTRGKDPLSTALRKYIERGGIPGEGYIGIYSPEDRKLRIDRFLEKRKHRMWTKKVKYDVRKVSIIERIAFLIIVWSKKMFACLELCG